MQGWSIAQQTPALTDDELLKKLHSKAGEIQVANEQLKQISRERQAMNDRYTAACSEHESAERACRMAHQKVEAVQEELRQADFDNRIVATQDNLAKITEQRNQIEKACRSRYDKAQSTLDKLEKFVDIHL